GSPGTVKGPCISPGPITAIVPCETRAMNRSRSLCSQGRAAGAGGRAMEHERAVADRLKRRADHWEILGAAARHHRLDRRLFRRDGSVAHGLVKQHLTRL